MGIAKRPNPRIAAATNHLLVAVYVPSTREDPDGSKPRHYFRFFRYFSFADKTPEQILVETQWATAIVLIGVGLFAHSLLPIFPAAVYY